MEYRSLKTRQVGATLWVEIHNPPVNWLTTDICEELFCLVRKVEKDTSIRVFILTGGIEDVYIMHFSIPELVRISPDNEKIEFMPFYSFKHTAAREGKKAFWHATRREAGAHKAARIEPSGRASTSLRLKSSATGQSTMSTAPTTSRIFSARSTTASSQPPQDAHQ